MVPAPSSAKPRARAGAVRRALPHRLASTRNAAATMAEGLIVVCLAEADAADVEIALHRAVAGKHGYIALTASAHVMQEREIAPWWLARRPSSSLARQSKLGQGARAPTSTKNLIKVFRSLS